METQYKNLEVWEKSMQLAEDVFHLCEKLPKNITYSLSDQMRRASLSIPSNIAE
jgi:four helix bundle protein